MDSQTLNGKGTFHGMGVIPIICCSKQKASTVKQLKHNSTRNLLEPSKHNSAPNLSEQAVFIFFLQDQIGIV